MDPALQGPSTGGFGLVIGLAVLGFAVVIGLGVVAARRNRERVGALQQWARSREWQYLPDDAALVRLVPRRLQVGSTRRVRNVLRGRLGGLPVTAFDYSYTTSDTGPSAGTDGGTTTSSTTHRYQVLLVQAPREWPPVSAEPSGFLHAVAVAFGGQDVEIGHPAFDGRFRVRADDEQVARRLLAVLAPALLARPDQLLDLDGSLLRLARRGELEPADLQAWLDEWDGPVARALRTDRDGTVQDA